MARTPDPDPIASLLDRHGDTRQYLQHLLDGAWTEAGLRAALAWFDGPAPAQHRLLRTVLCPLLIESMAGSDAVCIQGMAQGLGLQGAELDRQWRREIAPGLRARPPECTALPAWVRQYQAYLQRADDELLPMAGRLLDDQALDALARACREIGAGSPCAAPRP
ncbi:hypothetical protein ACMHYJ_06805 [Castellaniella hirudinis]|uniref:hypothetical protein n=1 Tax=Castellaniella hirudinis TaxID=1144617 RepID=UPI0039C36E98